MTTATAQAHPNLALAKVSQANTIHGHGEADDADIYWFSTTLIINIQVSPLVNVI